jgi:hypothetical protein
MCDPQVRAPALRLVNGFVSQSPPASRTARAHRPTPGAPTAARTATTRRQRPPPAATRTMAIFTPPRPFPRMCWLVGFLWGTPKAFGGPRGWPVRDGARRPRGGRLQENTAAKHDRTGVGNHQKKPACGYPAANQPGPAPSRPRPPPPRHWPGVPGPPQTALAGIQNGMFGAARIALRTA